MTADHPAFTRYWYIPHQGYEARSRRRLQINLGIDPEVAESILRMRSQVLELQARLRRLEVELAVQIASQNLRLAHCREDYFDADWIEVEYRN